jgi:DNA polymerase-4
MFEAARPLLRELANGTPYRLIGIGISNLEGRSGDAEERDLDPRHTSRTRAERAMDALKAKFGADAIDTGRGFRPRGAPPGDD